MSEGLQHQGRGAQVETERLKLFDDMSDHWSMVHSRKEGFRAITF